MSLTVNEGRALDRAIELETDVVVIGSGAGGATVATELALAGFRVVVLEEGKHVPAKQLGEMRHSQSLRTVWREGGLTAAFGLGDAPTVNVTMGRCVGGSSVVTGGVCFRVPESILAGWSRDQGIRELTAESLDPAYSHVEKAIHVEEVPVSMRSRSTTLFGEGAAKLGYPLVPLRRNTKGCDGCGRCNFGCPHQAKLSVDLSYLPRAVAAGAELWSDVLVDRVVVENGRATGVVGRTVPSGPGAPTRRVKVRAKTVVVACGGIHSPALLSASGLGGLRSHVGRHLTLHPGFRVYARFDESVRGWAGALQSAYSDHFMHEHITLMSLFVPASVIAATMPGVGPEHMARASQVANIAMFGALIHDEGGGYVVRSPFDREPTAIYRATKKDGRAMRRGIQIIGETFFAAGAREVYLPVLGSPALDADAFRRYDFENIPLGRLECASQHPLGTCRIGRSAKTGVVAPDGGFYGVDGLYVADGSVLPSSLGVNPQLTVMAVATFIAWQLREKRPRSSTFA